MKFFCASGSHVTWNSAVPDPCGVAYSCSYVLLIRRKKTQRSPAGDRTWVVRLPVGHSNHWATKPQQELRANFCLSPSCQFFQKSQLGYPSSILKKNPFQAPCLRRRVPDCVEMTGLIPDTSQPQAATKQANYSAFNFSFHKLCLIFKDRFLIRFPPNFQERLLMFSGSSEFDFPVGSKEKTVLF